MSKRYISLTSMLTIATLAYPSAIYESFDDIGAVELRVWSPDISYSYANSNTEMDNHQTTSSVRVNVDPAALKLQFIEISFQFDGFSITQEQDFTIGFGDSKRIVTEIWVDPFSLTYTSAFLHNLTPGSGGVFDIEDSLLTWGVDEFAFLYPTFTGNYEVRGPSESASGSFEFTFDRADQMGLLFPQLDTSGYPDGLELVAGHDCPSFGFFAGEAGIFVNEVVDGVSIETGIDRFKFNSQALARQLSPASIPEPSTMITILSFAAIFIGIKRRKR